MTIPTSTIKAVLSGRRTFTHKQLKNCKERSNDALVSRVLKWKLIKWNDVKATSIVKQSGDGISVSDDGEEATLIVSRASKYENVWTENTLLFEGQSPTDDDGTIELEKYRNNPKLIRAIVNGTLDVKKLKIFIKKCSNGWSPYDFSGKFIDIIPHLTNRGDLQFIVSMKSPVPASSHTLINVNQQLLYIMVLFMIWYMQTKKITF